MMPVSLKVPATVDELLRWVQKEAIPLLRQLRAAVTSTSSIRSITLGGTGVLLGMDATGYQKNDIVAVLFTQSCTLSPGGSPLPPAAPWSFSTHAPDATMDVTAGSRALFQYDGAAWQMLAIPVLK